MVEGCKEDKRGERSSGHFEEVEGEREREREREGLAHSRREKRECVSDRAGSGGGVLLVLVAVGWAG